MVIVLNIGKRIFLFKIFKKLHYAGYFPSWTNI